MQLHYFQRYHSKENVDTANTMLMLSRLYNHNTDKFFAMLNSLIMNESETPEIKFELQVVGKESVPDAIISQKSFKIIVETKLNNKFVKEQLINHLGQFKKEEIKIILSLDPRPMKKEMKLEFEKELKDYNLNNIPKYESKIKHINLTFYELVKAMEDIIDDRNTEIVEVLEDFKQYCFDEKLIPDRYKWMRAIVAGTTLEENLKLNIYYDLASRGYSEHGYVALYKGKCIRAIGKLVKTVLAEEIEGELICETESGDKITKEEIERVNIAIKNAEEKFGYNLRTNKHRYFFVDKFIEIEFRKVSKNPIQKSKYFNLSEMFGYEKMPETKIIAKALNGRSWEEFD